MAVFHGGECSAATGISVFVAFTRSFYAMLFWLVWRFPISLRGLGWSFGRWVGRLVVGSVSRSPVVLNIINIRELDKTNIVL